MQYWYYTPEKRGYKVLFRRHPGRTVPDVRLEDDAEEVRRAVSQARDRHALLGQRRHLPGSFLEEPVLAETPLPASANTNPTTPYPSI